MSRHERDFFTEKEERKPAMFTCPKCRPRAESQVRWVRRVKKDRPHMVPLSPAARALLDDLPMPASGKGFVFSTDGGRHWTDRATLTSHTTTWGKPGINISCYADLIQVGPNRLLAISAVGPGGDFQRQAGRGDQPPSLVRLPINRDVVFVEVHQSAVIEDAQRPVLGQPSVGQTAVHFVDQAIGLRFGHVGPSEQALKQVGQHCERVLRGYRSSVVQRSSRSG